MPRFEAPELIVFARGLLEALGSSAEAAGQVAGHLVESNLAGHDSHGLIRLSQYAEQAADGHVDPTAAPRIEREGPTTALVDGGKAWGVVAASFAARVALEKARATQIAAVALRNTHHVGRIGVYLEAAVREGFAAQAFCNGHGVCRVAPWGGREARLATNPIAFAFPTREEPVIVDFATSTVAEGKVRLARARGERIPEGWVLAADGTPSTDPDTLYTGGTLHPLGDAQGHKGFGLSLTADLLAGVIAGAGAGLLEPRYGNGLFFVVIDITAFCEREEYLERAAEYLRYLRSSTPREAGGRVRIPGEPERETAARRLADGIVLDDDTWRRLEALAEKHGVEPPRGAIDV